MSTLSRAIATVLLQEDIEGFIKAGAPTDEYMNEAAQVAAAIQLLDTEQRSLDNILAILAAVWVKNFEISTAEFELRLPGIRQAAQAIYQLTHHR